MSVKPSQRFVRAGDVLILLGVIAANAPPEKSLTRTHRNALVSLSSFINWNTTKCKTRKQLCLFLFSFVKGAVLEIDWKNLPSFWCLSSVICVNFLYSYSFYFLFNLSSPTFEVFFCLREVFEVFIVCKISKLMAYSVKDCGMTPFKLVLVGAWSRYLWPALRSLHRLDGPLRPCHEISTFVGIFSCHSSIYHMWFSKIYQVSQEYEAKLVKAWQVRSPMVKRCQESRRSDPLYFKLNPRTQIVHAWFS